MSRRETDGPEHGDIGASSLAKASPRADSSALFDTFGSSGHTPLDRQLTRHIRAKEPPWNDAARERIVARPARYRSCAFTTQFQPKQNARRSGSKDYRPNVEIKWRPGRRLLVSRQLSKCDPLSSSLLFVSLIPSS